MELGKILIAEADAGKPILLRAYRRFGQGMPYNKFCDSLLSGQLPTAEKALAAAQEAAIKAIDNFSKGGDDMEMSKTAFVIMNEQHALLPVQVAALRKTFDGWEFVKAPAKGWTLEEQREIAYNLGDAHVVFVSPIPVLMSMRAAMHPDKTWVFHNDKRMKKELANGRIVWATQNDGWELINIGEEVNNG